MKKRNIYGLGYAPCNRIMKDMYFLTLKGAKLKAREENRFGEYKGRGVKPVKIGTWEPPSKDFKPNDEAYDKRY